MAATRRTGDDAGFQSLAELMAERQPSRDRQRAELKRRAIALLARREYSRAELARKLLSGGGGFGGRGRRSTTAGGRSRRGRDESAAAVGRDASTGWAAAASGTDAWDDGRPPRDDSPEAAEQAQQRRQAVSAELVEQVLDELSEQRLLSDRRMAEALVRSGSARFGAARLQQDLQRKGVDPALIGDVLHPLADNEIERARAVWQRRFGQPPTDIKDKARQYRFLLGRGFASRVVAAVVPALSSRSADEDESFDDT